MRPIATHNFTTNRLPNYEFGHNALDAGGRARSRMASALAYGRNTFTHAATTARRLSLTGQNNTGTIMSENTVALSEADVPAEASTSMKSPYQIATEPPKVGASATTQKTKGARVAVAPLRLAGRSPAVPSNSLPAPSAKSSFTHPMEVAATALNATATPEALARRVEALERRLAAVEAGGPLADVVPLLTRIADAIAPAPVALVGTPYVACKLGCTTVWVAEMARQGDIPRTCVVPGTGVGKVWKFYRDRIDLWVAGR